jgi:hypothetical protein
VLRIGGEEHRAEQEVVPEVQRHRRREAVAVPAVREAQVAADQGDAGDGDSEIPGLLVALSAWLAPKISDPTSQPVVGLVLRVSSDWTYPRNVVSSAMATCSKSAVPMAAASG